MDKRLPFSDIGKNTGKIIVTTAETAPDNEATIVEPDDQFVESLTMFIANDFSDEDTAVVGDTDLLLTGLVDSLGVVRIVIWIESALNIEIDPIDVVLENFQTIDQMVAYLRAR